MKKIWDTFLISFFKIKCFLVNFKRIVYNLLQYMKLKMHVIIQKSKNFKNDNNTHRENMI